MSPITYEVYSQPYGLYVPDPAQMTPTFTGGGIGTITSDNASILGFPTVVSGTQYTTDRSSWLGLSFNTVVTFTLTVPGIGSTAILRFMYY
jgi:hypothetical protein